VEVLLLDEPTSGLLSSHVLSEAEVLCERVSIIRDGRIVETGTPADLRHPTRMSVTAELSVPPDGRSSRLAIRSIGKAFRPGSRRPRSRRFAP
jgi:ABC-type multidrug transport system ATPase subunit